MSDKHAGIATLIHDALVAFHDRNYGLAEGKMMELSNLFFDGKLDHDEIKQFVEAEHEALSQGETYVNRSVINKIIEDWQQFKPKLP